MTTGRAAIGDHRSTLPAQAHSASTAPMQSVHPPGATNAATNGRVGAGEIAFGDLLTVASLSHADLRRVLATAHAFKREPARFARALAGKSVVMLFEKPSLRTRVSFEVGVARLGGHALYYDHGKERIGQRESVKDYAKNLERWVHAIVARVYAQKTLEELAAHARVPVVNALSDSDHPCQALADVLTLEERFGTVEGLRVAYVGDGNNVCVSLAEAVTTLGGHMRVICPRGYEPDAGAMQRLARIAATNGGSVELIHDAHAVTGCAAVYTDTWVSMHQESESDARERAFVPFRVDAALMARAGAGGNPAVFMHCLPAHRGEEVTDEVIDSPQSLVYDQAENRLHAQNAALLHLLGGAES